MKTIINMVKCSKIDAENVGSDLQNDSSTDIVLDSSYTALDKSEMEVIQVNYVTLRAPATSECMDVLKCFFLALMIDSYVTIFPLHM